MNGDLVDSTGLWRGCFFEAAVSRAIIRVFLNLAGRKKCVWYSGTNSANYLPTHLSNQETLGTEQHLAAGSVRQSLLFSPFLSVTFVGDEVPTWGNCERCPARFETGKDVCLQASSLNRYILIPKQLLAPLMYKHVPSYPPSMQRGDRSCSRFPFPFALLCFFSSSFASTVLGYRSYQ